MSFGHGNPRAQARAYLQAQAHADLSGNEFAQIVIWDELGYVLLIGETPFSNVRNHMQREVDWAEERGIAFTAADGQLGIAYCQHAAGELVEARSTLERLHHIFASLPGDVSQHGESYQLSGAVERDARDPEAAITYFKKAREVFDAIGSQSWWHGSSNGLAHAYLDAGQPDEAERVLDEITGRVMAGTPRTESAESAARARLKSARGDHSAALELIAEGLARSLSGVNPQSQGRMLEYVAEINEAAGNLADARGALERALELYEAKEFELGRSRVADRLRAFG